MRYVLVSAIEQLLAAFPVVANQAPNRQRDDFLRAYAEIPSNTLKPLEVVLMDPDV